MCNDNGFSKIMTFRKSLVLLIALALLSSLFLNIPKVSAADKDTQMKRVAQELLIVGKAQFKKKMFKAAKASLTKAKGYSDYLSDAQNKELDSLLSQLGQQSQANKEFEETLERADILIAQQKYAQASQLLGDFANTNDLTPEMKTKLFMKQQTANEKLSGQKQRLEAVYAQSVNLYEQGQLEEARIGFEEIALTGARVAPAGLTAKDYIAKIDAKLAASKVVEPEPVVEVEPIEEFAPETKLMEIPEDTELTQPIAPQPQPDDIDVSSSYINKVNQQRAIQQSFTKAVVNDAIGAAEDLKQMQQYDQALAKLIQAQTLVEKNRMALGDQLYKAYSTELDIKEKQITQLQAEHERTVVEGKIIEGRQKAEQFKTQQEKQRQKRIAELLENARVFQKQQRYEEALNQIEMLLAIDPLNDIALTTKMVLKDTISFRKQVEMRDELEEAEVGSLLNVTEATIPYDDDITYAKNWREISARRDKTFVNGQAAEDAAIYRQLSEIVDLSSLTVDTPFSTAVDVLARSVTPPLNIVVLWKDLSDNAYIDPETPINMQGVPAIPLKSGLELLLESVSGGFAELAYQIEGGIIKIATKGEIKVTMTTEVYDVTELLMPKSIATFELEDISELGETQEARGGSGGSRGRSSSSSQDYDDPQTILEASAASADQIIQTIISSIDPDSWYDNGGDATIQLMNGNQLIVKQTPENHRAIENLIKSLRSSLGQQIAIEARFLIVTESFLENINIDFDFAYNLGGDFGKVAFEQQNLSGEEIPAISFAADAGDFLDDLQVEFLVEATQSIDNSRILQAPKVTVLSGESAAIRITNSTAYVGDYEFENISQSNTENVTIVADPEIYTVTDGVGLNVTPTVSVDKKYVLLTISTALSNVTLTDFEVPSETGTDFPIKTPLLDSTTIRTRVKVPDQGTLLIGGLKVNRETENEKGVPIMSKIPGIGRLFRNRKDSREQEILLILVKPTILLQDETEEDAMSSL